MSDTERVQERQEITLARIETLLARMMRGDTNVEPLQPTYGLAGDSGYQR
jgi:hypothetical protein